MPASIRIPVVQFTEILQPGKPDSTPQKGHASPKMAIFWQYAETADRISDLLGRLTLQEKVNLMQTKHDDSYPGLLMKTFGNGRFASLILPIYVHKAPFLDCIWKNM
mgnify:CR=1 FL=1